MIDTAAIVLVLILATCVVSLLAIGVALLLGCAIELAQGHW